MKTKRLIEAQRLVTLAMGELAELYGETTDREQRAVLLEVLEHIGSCSVFTSEVLMYTASDEKLDVEFKTPNLQCMIDFAVFSKKHKAAYHRLMRKTNRIPVAYKPGDKAQGLGAPRDDGQ